MRTRGRVAVLDWGGRGVIADICKSRATSAKSQPAQNVLYLVTKFFWTTASCCLLRIKIKIWYSDYVCLFCSECYKVLLVQNFGGKEHSFAWFKGLKFGNTPFLSRCTENKYETMTFDLGEDFPVSYGMSGCGSRKCAAHYMHWVYTAVRLNRSSLFENLCVECPLLHLTVEASKVSSKESDLSSPPSHLNMMLSIFAADTAPNCVDGINCQQNCTFYIRKDESVKMEA